MNSNSGAENISAQPTVTGNDVQNLSPNQPQTIPTLETELPQEQEHIPNPMMQKKLAEDKALQERLNSRSLPATGNPNATISDPMMVRVEPRYNIIQNRSNKILLVPDLKTGVEDMGLQLQPGEHIVLTDFYSPQEINRSKGLLFAATKMPGVAGNMALVPIASTEQALEFKPPERRHYEPGTMIIDESQNDFDDRFEELLKRDAKRDEKLIKKTLGMRKQKQHGSVPQA